MAPCFERLKGFTYSRCCPKLLFRRQRSCNIGPTPVLSHLRRGYHCNLAFSSGCRVVCYIQPVTETQWIQGAYKWKALDSVVLSAYWLCDSVRHQLDTRQLLIMDLQTNFPKHLYFVVRGLNMQCQFDPSFLTFQTYDATVESQIRSDIGLLRVDKRNSTIHSRNDIRNNVNE